MELVSTQTDRYIGMHGTAFKSHSCGGFLKVKAKCFLHYATAMFFIIDNVTCGNVQCVRMYHVKNCQYMNCLLPELSFLGSVISTGVFIKKTEDPLRIVFCFQIDRYSRNKRNILPVAVSPI